MPGISNSTDRFNGVVTSLAIKVPCRVVSIVDLTLNGEQTVNGIAVVTGDRVLVNAQTAGAENGIYDVKSTAWDRAADWDGNRDATERTIVIVGTAVPGANIMYQCDTTGNIVIGSTAVSFSIWLDPAVVAASSLQAVTDVGAITNNSIQLNGGSLLIVESAAKPDASVATIGQLWMRNDAPNVLMFTDDVGTDFLIGGAAAEPSGVGAVGSIKYTYSGSAGGNPGADSFRTSTGNLTITTAFYFSDTDVDSLDVQNILSTIPIGAHFVIRKVDDSSQFRIYAITNIIDNAGWYQFSCDYLFGNGDTTALTVSDEITIEFFTSAYVEPGAEVASQSDILYWESAEARWEASGTLIRINPNSPPLGGRLQLGTTSGYSTASPQIMRPLGAADTVMDFIYATDPNNGFLQGYRRVAGEMSFGARIASVNTDMLTLDLSSRVRIQPAAAFMIGEKAAAAADLAAYGQLWVRNDAPNVLVYTNDVGTDFVLNAGGAPVPPIVLLDNEQVQYGTGTDVTVDFDGTNFRTIGPAALWLVTGFDQVRFDASIGQNEAAAPDGNVAGVGQWWVRSSAPCRPEFRDDTDVNQLLDPSISEIVSVVASRNLVLTDKGKTIGFTGATAAQTMTIPADGSVAYQIGTFLGFDNSGSVSHSIAITTDTLIFADDNSVGTRTLAAGGAAVAQKVGATTWKIAGAGLT